MKNNKLLIIIVFFATFQNINSEIPYPIIYIPGIFDNGDLLTDDSYLVKNLNHKDGFYYNNYFNSNYNYEKEILFCSSNIVNSKYNRLVVANLIGKYRTNISLYLMSDRFFCLMQGKKYFKSNYKNTINYQGNDFYGYILKDNKKIYFFGLIEELWAKYGKKVYYKKIKDKYYISLDIKNNKNYYLNNDYYFENIEEIKFNIIAHSSGGLIIRKYLQMCKEKQLFHHINSIINLSVPQKGAKMNFALKNAFQKLIKEAINNFFYNKDKGLIKFKVGDQIFLFTYKELIEKSKIDLLYGDNNLSIFFRNIIANYILYFIPIDGKQGVLGRDPSLYDLHPENKFIKQLNNYEIPEQIKIYNFIVKKPYAKMFEFIGKYLNLSEYNDGVVDIDEPLLDHIPNYKKLKIKNYYVEKANHIPMPYIKPLFELNKTINDNYFFLQILLKKNYKKIDGVPIIQALFLSIMKEISLELDNFLKYENYSVIDYFAENPIIF